jgi:hypothetical protein
MSGVQWRGFIIRFQNGNLTVTPEGSDVSLLQWQDPHPLPIKFFSFSSYNGRLLEVAFDCKPKDIFSSIPKAKGQNHFIAFSFIIN